MTDKEIKALAEEIIDKTVPNDVFLSAREWEFVQSAMCEIYKAALSGTEVNWKKLTELWNCNGNKLYFTENEKYQLDVEARGQPFKAKVSAKQLRKFYRVLGIIEEQPITLTIDEFNSNWINFHAVI